MFQARTKNIMNKRIIELTHTNKPSRRDTNPSQRTSNWRDRFVTFYQEIFRFFFFLRLRFIMCKTVKLIIVPIHLYDHL